MTLTVQSCHQAAHRSIYEILSCYPSRCGHIIFPRARSQYCIWLWPQKKRDHNVFFLRWFPSLSRIYFHSFLDENDSFWYTFFANLWSVTKKMAKKCGSVRSGPVRSLFLNLHNRLRFVSLRLQPVKVCNAARGAECITYRCKWSLTEDTPPPLRAWPVFPRDQCQYFPIYRRRYQSSHISSGYVPVCPK